MPVKYERNSGAVVALPAKPPVPGLAYGDAGPATFVQPSIWPWNWNWLAPWGIPLSPFGLGGLGLRARPRPAGAISEMVTPMTAWLVGAAVGGVTTYVAVKKLGKKK